MMGDTQQKKPRKPWHWLFKFCLWIILVAPTSFLAFCGLFLIFRTGTPDPAAPFPIYGIGIYLLLLACGFAIPLIIFLIMNHRKYFFATSGIATCLIVFFVGAYGYDQYQDAQHADLTAHEYKWRSINMPILEMARSQVDDPAQSLKTLATLTPIDFDQPELKQYLRYWKGGIFLELTLRDPTYYQMFRDELHQDVGLICDAIFDFGKGTESFKSDHVDLIFKIIDQYDITAKSGSIRSACGTLGYSFLPKFPKLIQNRDYRHAMIRLNYDDENRYRVQKYATVAVTIEDVIERRKILLRAIEKTNIISWLDETGKQFSLATIAEIFRIVEPLEEADVYTDLLVHLLDREWNAPTKYQKLWFLYNSPDVVPDIGYMISALGADHPIFEHVPQSIIEYYNP